MFLVGCVILYIYIVYIVVAFFIVKKKQKQKTFCLTETEDETQAVACMDTEHCVLTQSTTLIVITPGMNAQVIAYT